MNGQEFSDRMSTTGKALLERIGLEERMFCESQSGRCWLRRADGTWWIPSKRILRTFLIGHGLSTTREHAWNYLSRYDLVMLYLDIDAGFELTKEARNKLKADRNRNGNGQYALSDIRRWCSREYIEEQRGKEAMRREFGGEA